MNSDADILRLSSFNENEKMEIKSFCAANNMSVNEFFLKSVMYCLYKRVFQKEMKLIGQFLLDDKVITREQLNMALDRQEESRELLGSIMVKMNFLDEETLSKYLAIQILDV